MKTTKKHFILFQEECQKWMDKFELNDWKVYFHHGGNNRDTFATIEFKFRGRVASIYFARDFYDKDNQSIMNKIKGTARHEMIHLMLARFSGIANSRYVTEDEACEAEEELVRKIESLIK